VVAVTAKKSASKSQEYATADALKARCEAYFSQCDEDEVLYGEAGLALYLNVTIKTLRRWYDGERHEDFQDTVQMAFLRIQNQIETDPRYQEKGMVTRGIFLNKQPRFGGYQDKVEARQDISVNVNMGKGMDESDFK